MQVGHFEIRCVCCGSEDVAMVDRRSGDSDFDEKYTVLKCKHCDAETEI